MTIRTLLVAFSLALVGCDHDHTTTPEAGASTCGSDARAMPYSANLVLGGMAGVVKTKLISSEPGPPLKGDNKWMVEVTDAQSGAALDNVKIDAVPFMPDHGHFSPIKVVVTPMGSGVYQLNPVNLFMAGVWKVTLNLTTSDNKTDQTIYWFCIEG